MLAERVKQWTEEWKQQGKLEGKLEGRLEGKLEGKLEGRHEEAAQLLRRLLTLRFGPLPEWAEARVNEATRERLETWTLRILDAPTLEAVFQND